MAKDIVKLLSQPGNLVILVC